MYLNWPANALVFCFDQKNLQRGILMFVVKHNRRSESRLHLLEPLSRH